MYHSGCTPTDRRLLHLCWCGTLLLCDAVPQAAVSYYVACTQQNSGSGAGTIVPSEQQGNVTAEEDGCLLVRCAALDQGHTGARAWVRSSCTLRYTRVGCIRRLWSAHATRVCAVVSR